ncbi:MAG: pyridoxamine 5'-phosphate oxidase family protein [Candidatus Methanoplasma sp.]|jgi:predicted pyridoxine 5'-phosphate oxidase superfamily flavin-nucleotide-binding protein|nr:pyridoxamine 5'-phosphate oxidase family protein [Candidatus Methanoplasma sp.]
MTKLSEDVKKVLSANKLFPLATSSRDGTPNVVPVGMLMLQPDGETIWIVDNFMGKTLSNLRENPAASFYVWSADSPDSYQIKGEVTLEDSGEDYERAVSIAHARKETLPAKTLIKMRVSEVFYTTPGPKAGKRA